MGGYSNPFDVPLNSEVQESQQRQQARMAASDNGNPFDEPLASEIAEQKHAAAYAEGQVTNDVGQQVIVPKAGESFHDTMQRAVALGKQRVKEGSQQTAIDAETKTIPAKTAETLGGAAGIGVAGPALLAVPGELAGAFHTPLGGTSLVNAAIEHLGGLTKIVQAAKAMGWTAFGIKEAHDLFKMVSGGEKK
jgi:hypothetical protein